MGDKLSHSTLKLREANISADCEQLFFYGVERALSVDPVVGTFLCLADCAFRVN